MGENKQPVKPAFNAIKVSDKIEKVYLDFSSFESLKQTSGVKRFYTIHTAETNALGNNLGFHVGGFCDDRGNGGHLLAAQVAGYDSLPSDLFLCLMDNEYNFLPLDKKQLDALYDYLLKHYCYEDVEDAIEESFENYDNEESDLMDYVLIFKVNAVWPKSSDNFKFHTELCYPLFIDNKPSFPCFEEMFNLEGYDRIHGLVNLLIKRGQGEEHIDLKVDEELKFDFAYNTGDSDETYKEGTASLILKHFNFVDKQIPGRLHFHSNLTIGGIEQYDETNYIDNINDDMGDECEVELPNYDSVGVFMIDATAEFMILYNLRVPSDAETQQSFIPLYFDKTVEESTHGIYDGETHIETHSVKYEKE